VQFRTETTHPNDTTNRRMLPKDSGEAQYVDLHVHTKHSDGASSVDEVLAVASAQGLQAISITDHDTIDAYPAALERAGALGIEVIPGVEISSNIGRTDIHILGYCIDIENRALRGKLQEMRDARFVRARRMVERLNAQGIDLRFETVLKVAGPGAIGRPHIAAAMMQEELIYSVRDAFERLIGYDSPAYVEKMQIAPRDVFQLILQAGGIPVLAHPALTRVDEHIPQFVRDGLMGMEVMHAEPAPAAERYYRELCGKHGLLMTGGSDYHSPAQSGRVVIGWPRVPAAFAQMLKGERASLVT
jgi:predicted metal-dependent phosphoesterase TrpH